MPPPGFLLGFHRPGKPWHAKTISIVAIITMHFHDYLSCCFPFYNVKYLGARCCIIFISWLHVPYREADPERHVKIFEEMNDWSDLLGKKLIYEHFSITSQLTSSYHSIFSSSSHPLKQQKGIASTQSNNCFQSFLATSQCPPPSFAINSYWFSNQKSQIHWCDCKVK